MSERRALTRTIRVGETITLDNGRIVMQMLERTGRNAARVRFDLDADVVVNKPGYRSAATFAREGIQA